MDRQLSFLESQEPLKTFTLFIDGASRGNPGLAGAGAYLAQNEKEAFSKDFFLGEKTNNQAEYLALCLGAFCFVDKFKQDINNTVLTITSDSQLLVRQMIGFYKVKDPTLQLLKSLAQELLKNVKEVHFKHVLRTYNKKADALANKAIDQRSNSIPKEFLSMLQKYNLENLLS